MRASVFIPRLRLTVRPVSLRTFATTTRPLTQFAHPAPPNLPKEEQEIWEKLQTQSTGAFSNPAQETTSSPSTQSRSVPKINQSPDSSPSATEELKIEVQADGEGEELHPHIRRGAPPEFEGDVNPKTGEVGGPKNEPLRWGGDGDWSYNGRVTDF